MTVQSGAPITIHTPAFAEGTYGLTRDFLLKQETTLSVDAKTYELSSAWTTPQQLDRHLWVTRLPELPLGITLASGESVVVTFAIRFSHPLAVLYPSVGSSGDNGPFLTGEEGPLSCVISA